MFSPQQGQAHKVAQLNNVMGELSKKKLNADLDLLKKESLRLTDKDLLESKRKEELLRMNTLEHKDLKSRLEAAESQLQKLLQEGSEDITAQESMAEFLEDEELAELEKELEAAKEITAMIKKIIAENEIKKQKKALKLVAATITASLQASKISL